MKTTREERLTQPYVLEPGDLERICADLSSYVDTISFELECRDRLKRQFENLEELLTFENPPKKDIKTLRLTARSNKREIWIWLKLDKDARSNILIHIEADEVATTTLSECLDERLAAMKPWYGRIAKMQLYKLYTLLTAFLGLMLGSILVFAVAFGKISFADPSNAIGALALGALIGLTVLILLTFLDRLKLSLFPMGAFTIGQGAKRHKNKELVRTSVVIAFFVSLAASIVAALIISFK